MKSRIASISAARAARAEAKVEPDTRNVTVATTSLYKEDDRTTYSPGYSQVTISHSVVERKNTPLNRLFER